MPQSSQGMAQEMQPGGPPSSKSMSGLPPGGPGMPSGMSQSMNPSQHSVPSSHQSCMPPSHPTQQMPGGPGHPNNRQGMPQGPGMPNNPPNIMPGMPPSSQPNM